MINFEADTGDGGELYGVMRMGPVKVTLYRSLIREDGYSVEVDTDGDTDPDVRMWINDWRMVPASQWEQVGS